MIPKALQERADVLGLKVTRPKNRSAAFEVEVLAPDGEVIYSHAQIVVAAWLDGAIWAAKVHERIDPRS